jgi:hypothetical protein
MNSPFRRVLLKMDEVNHNNVEEDACRVAIFLKVIIARVLPHEITGRSPHFIALS